MTTSFFDGRHLRAARVLAGMTRQELADSAGMHINSVKYWENSAGIDLNGWAIERIAAVLADRGVEARVDSDDDISIAIVRFGQFPATRELALADKN